MLLWAPDIPIRPSVDASPSTLGKLIDDKEMDEKEATDSKDSSVATDHDDDEDPSRTPSNAVNHLKGKLKVR
jgi:hypothetical protein